MALTRKNVSVIRFEKVFGEVHSESEDSSVNLAVTFIN